MLKYLMPIEAAILITLVILVAKEVVWDKWLKTELKSGTILFGEP
jgi:hypothetical protein